MQKDADNALAEINDLQESDKEARLVASITGFENGGHSDL